MKTILALALAVVAATAFAQNKTEVPRTEFSVNLSENTLTLKPGEAKQVVVNIVRSKSFSKEKATLGIMSELPKGITVTYEPNDGNFDSSTATISAANDAVLGNYSLVMSSTLSHRKKGSILKLIVSTESIASK